MTLTACVMAAFSVPALFGQNELQKTQQQNTPWKIWECEAAECGLWVFTGQSGIAMWPSGTRANLVLRHADAQGFVVQRSDNAGGTPGLTAVSTGKRVGNRVEGEVTLWWPGHWDGEQRRTFTATMKPPLKTEHGTP